MKKNNKKGFTLAELLIVVAIIAVLTAIAVPLFVGALGNAEDKVGAANCRAVRGLVIAEILGDTSNTVAATDVYYGYGEVDGNGDVSKVHFIKSSAVATDIASAVTDWKIQLEKGTDNNITISTTGLKFADGKTTVADSTVMYLKDGNNYYCLVKLQPKDLKNS